MATKRKDIPEAAAPKAAGNHPAYKLIAEGDNRAARAMARELAASPTATEDERRIAADVLGRTGFDPGAIGAGLIGVSVLAVIVSLLYLG